MNGDLQELMEYIGSKHNDQMAAISALGREFSEHKGRIETRVAAVEKEVADTKKWHNIKSALGPVMVLVEAVARKFGLHI